MMAYRILGILATFSSLAICYHIMEQHDIKGSLDYVMMENRRTDTNLGCDSDDIVLFLPCI